MESSFDFAGYFAALCDKPSNSNVSEVWFLEDNEILIGGRVAAAFLLLFLLIGLPLNLIVMAIILKKRHCRKATYVLMFSLLMNDLIFTALVIPVQILTVITGEFWSVLQTDRAKCALCKTWSMLFSFSSSAPSSPSLSCHSTDSC